MFCLTLYVFVLEQRKGRLTNQDEDSLSPDLAKSSKEIQTKVLGVHMMLCIENQHVLVH